MYLNNFFFISSRNLFAQPPQLIAKDNKAKNELNPYFFENSNKNSSEEIEKLPTSILTLK